MAIVLPVDGSVHSLSSTFCIGSPLVVSGTSKRPTDTPFKLSGAWLREASQT